VNKEMFNHIRNSLRAVWPWPHEVVVVPPVDVSVSGSKSSQKKLFESIDRLDKVVDAKIERHGSVSPMGDVIDSLVQDRKR
jgi:hypothetical protein